MSGKIPRSFIDDLLNRVDIVEIIEAGFAGLRSEKDLVVRLAARDHREAVS